MELFRASLMLALSGLISTNLWAANLATALVEKVEMPDVYQLNGTVEAVNKGTLSAQTSGQITKILVDVRDLVQEGQLIIQLKDTEQKARLDQAKANLQSAVAALQQAQREFNRVKGVFAKKLVSKSEMDNASANLKRARAQKKAAEAALQQAAEQYAYTQIRAPYTGVVTKRHVELGETVQPGMPLISGVSLDELRVTVDLPQSLMPAVRAQREGQVLIPGGDWVAATRLTIFPLADPGSNTFQTRMLLPPKLRDLFPGMFVKAAFTTGTERLLAIPGSAVAHRSEVTAAYVMKEDGAIYMRHIRLGRRLPGDRVAVLAGLAEGEAVAIDPVAAGVALKAQRAE